ncbi:hypothetical protein SAR116_0087 [Candidatus Puniceispirillum marinum IMCC1322]|uniref:Uncharacterized protein n=1 Tax=Puniceispirillum marinum (strain IMCC1322) TaxID=488538 RepID=D5BNR3_PUNMI|nr:hypothetical protein SAR116_0087 [Candidatus Puniceispirillum marinum IMCC1322]
MIGLGADPFEIWGRGMLARRPCVAPVSPLCRPCVASYATLMLNESAKIEQKVKMLLK